MPKKYLVDSEGYVVIKIIGGPYASNEKKSCKHCGHEGKFFHNYSRCKQIRTIKILEELNCANSFISLGKVGFDEIGLAWCADIKACYSGEQNNKVCVAIKSMQSLIFSYYEDNARVFIEKKKSCSWCNDEFCNNKEKSKELKEAILKNFNKYLPQEILEQLKQVDLDLTHLGFTMLNSLTKFFFGEKDSDMARVYLQGFYYLLHHFVQAHKFFQRK